MTDTQQRLASPARAARAMQLPPWGVGVLGGVTIIAIWWLLAATVFAAGGSVPTPPEVIAGYGASGIDYYLRHFGVTLAEAGIGYLAGTVLALVLAALVLVVPRLDVAIMHLATLTYCVPIVAIGLIAVVVIPAPSPGEPAGTAIFLAALSVFFTTVVGALLGLRAADAASLDVVFVYGGSRLTQLTKVRLIAAVPNIMTALQVAVPAAFLGAVLAEFFGKVELGVGAAMIPAMQTGDAARLWGLALASGAVSLAGYGLVGLLGRLVAPWSKGSR